MELFVFSQDEQLLTIISEDTGLVEALYRIEVNSIPTEPFSFTVESDQKVAEHVKEENKVMFKDHEGDWRLMNIKEVDDSNDIDGPVTIATCEPAFLAELNEHIVVDRQFVNQTADVVLAAAVEGTRWQTSVEVELGRATVSFYYISSMEAIWETIETWGGEFKDIVNFDETTNKITGCYVKILQRLGAENGQRFEIDHNTTEIGRTVLSYPKTALYGQGASLKTENDDSTRYIDFGDVEWRADRGDPVDKPLGQKWVGDPDALDKYGILEEGKKRHRDGTYSNQDYEEPSELLYATWESLQKAKKPEVNYRLSVELFNEKVNLGDTCQAIDRKFARPIEIQARVIAMEYDLMDIEGTMVVEMGQFLDLGDNRLDNLEREVEEIKSRPPSARIDENSFPDRKPSTPVDLESYGGFEVIQLYWQYADEMFIKYYEVYGSRTEDFVPDIQHLLWRGDVSAFAHTVATDEVWYYRVRAVNYHGRSSDWSVQVRAATQRIMDEDILWGPEIAERMRELHRISDIIGENGIDFDQISQEAKDLIHQQVRIYTDEEIQSAWDGIMGELDIRTDLLDDRVTDLNQRAADLISRADETEDILREYSVRIDETERGLEFKADSTEINRINGEIRGHETWLEILDEGLQSKVSETFVRDAIDGIEISSRNLASINAVKKWSAGSMTRDGYKYTLANANGSTNAGLYIDRTQFKNSTEYVVSFKVKKVSGTVYTIAGHRNAQSSIEKVYKDGVLLDTPNGWNSGDINYNNSADEHEYVIYFTTSINAVENNNHPFYLQPNRPSYSESFVVEVWDLQLEEGNKKTGWQPAPEDILSVQEHHSTLIEQNSREVRIQAESIIDIEGDITSAQARINVMSEEINERVTKTIYDQETGNIRQSLADVRNFAEGIEQTVSTIEIGSVNLLTNSDFSKGLTEWNFQNGVSAGNIVTQENGNLIIEKSSNSNPSFLKIGIGGGIDNNRNLVAQVKARTVSGIGTMRTRFGTGVNSSSETFGSNFETKYFKVTKNGNNNFVFELTSTGRLEVEHVQLEFGTIPSDYRVSQDELNKRMSTTESSITQLADELEVKVDVDGIVSEINLKKEGIRISGNLIHLDGLTLIDDAIIQNAHIANGAITRAKLGTAIIGTAQIENAAITNAKIASVNADKINAANLAAISANLGTVTAGRLNSSNNNMDLNLNTGSLTMQNANFKLGNGADIEFTHFGNRIYYSGNLRGTAGLGVGRSINDTLPFAFLGTASTNDAVNPRDQDNFSGFIANRMQRYHEDGIGNSVVGHRFDVRNSATAFEWGFMFDIRGNRKVLRGINSGTYNYDLGATGQHFQRLYVNSIYSTESIVLRSAVSGYSSRGFTAELTYTNGLMHFRGTHSAENHALGRPSWRFQQLYLSNSPNVSSDERLKENISDNPLGLDFINRVETKTFNFKQASNDLGYKPIQLGVIAQQLLPALESYGIEHTKHSILTLDEDGYFGVKYEQFTIPLIKSVQEIDVKLNEEINWQHIEYQALKNKVTQLEDRVKELEELVA
ncbi:phage tail spike protein [Oceanobacillus sp. FSL W8-0428]|uniref:phage tail spike protein n=1 Tax=Oceanobacillus sp. FSL W8-0428 TaxID=2921715 RepID=UPI0030FA5AA7